MLALLKRRTTLHVALPSVFRLADRKAGLSLFERAKPAVRSVRAKRYNDFRSHSSISYAEYYNVRRESLAKSPEALLGTTPAVQHRDERKPQNHKPVVLKQDVTNSLVPHNR